MQKKSEPRSTPVNRPLTENERELTRWILENGGPEAAKFLDQLDRARVTGQCKCGCASIDFSIDGLPTAPPGVRVLGDFVYGNETDLAGVFVFESNGILSGLEVYGLASDTPKVLPNPFELRPFKPQPS